MRLADAREYERLWYADDALARIARIALAPAELVYRTAVAVRNSIYDAGLGAHALALPALAVGNLTVGGTGKTPVSAEIVRRLRRAGARPAVVLRGYGGDEPLVHQRLNPDAMVVIAADRVAGAERAQALGADIVVLDDAFQHRRARRDADVVLISADQCTPGRRLLPAGPWREPIESLQRATLVLITRKAVSDSTVQAVQDAVRSVYSGQTGIASLGMGSLVAVEGTGQIPLETVRGHRILAIAAIGDPGAFLRQLESAGATVAARTFSDHHQFSADDVERIAGDAATVDHVVCTLKDAVKLETLWPRAARPLWYVSQPVTFERGEDAVNAMLQSVLDSRIHDIPPAG